jgi:hypothetical protein
MSDTTYNGWTNYETWNVNLCLDNEEPMYRDIVRMTRRALVANSSEEATDELARDLRSYVTALFEEFGAFGDLRASDGDTISPVDWEEIAEAWVDAWSEDE